MRKLDRIMLIVGSVIVLGVGTLAWKYPRAFMPEGYVAPGIYRKTIDGHEYLMTGHNLTHSESCPCKNRKELE